MSNLELMKKAYSLFAEGKVPEVLALFDSNIEWRECTGFPFIEDNGISRGPEAVANEVFAQLPVHYDGFNIEVKEIF